MLSLLSKIDTKIFLFGISSLYFCFVYLNLSWLSISYKEAEIFFYGYGLLYQLVHLSTSIFGQNDFGLRAIFIFTNIINLILLHSISSAYLKKNSDVNLLLLIYILLPATISISVMINISIIIIFCLLLFIYLYQKFDTKSLFILPFYIFIDNSFVILYFALLFYGLYIKDNKIIVSMLILFGLSMYFSGFGVNGKPRNYFLDLLSVYATVFSPLLFIYIFYALYRILIKETKNILWFISFIPLIFSLVLSFRQKIYIEDFAPYILLSIVIAIRTFYTSYRGRLPQFRRHISLMFYIVFGFLILNLFVITFNKALYYFVDKPSHHFVYKHHIAKELANQLKDMQIYTIHTDDKRLALRLRFYGITHSREYLLTKKEMNDSIKVSIRYINKDIDTFFVTKVNNNN